MRPWALAALLALILPRAAFGEPSLHSVLKHVTAYVDSFGDRASILVATEHYAQQVSGNTRQANRRQMIVADIAIVWAAARALFGLSPSRTVALVISSGSRLLAAGIAIGVGTAALTAGGLAGMVYGLTPRDPSTYAAASGIVALLGLAGCYVPARRAAAISPAELLRSK